jgi:hypothetical protein
MTEHSSVFDLSSCAEGAYRSAFVPPWSSRSAMVHRVVQIVTRAVAVGLLVSSVALASGKPDKSLAEEHFEGTVTRIDAKGGAIITTEVSPEA